MKRLYPIICVVLCALLLIVAVAGPAGPAGAQGEQGATGEAGQDGITPQLRINEETNMWEVSYDSGKTWESMGVKATATGAQGETGESGKNGVTPQLRINEKTNMWEVSYNSGKTWTSLGIKAGGLNGANGANGTNGADGVTPQLRINDQTNMWEVSYDKGATWTSLGVKATGTSGANGTNGTNGTDGVTPQLRINGTTNEWEVSYDKGATWTSLGVKATGNNGQNGSVITIGENGNWFIDGVDTGVSAKCSCEEKEEEFVPVLRFAVAGDVHIRNDGAYASGERLASVFSSAYRYADRHDSYTGLDGIFFTGDNTNDGTAVQHSYFFDYLEQNARQGTVTRAVMGNHEFYANGYSNIAAGVELFLQGSGYTDDDAHLVIGDYHFIFLSNDNYNKGQNKYFTQTKLDWLKTELDTAVAADPTKPIFVFQHEPPYQTMKSSYGTSGDKNLRTLLNSYPQVIDFSGHTHSSLSDPRSIWQGEFTALTTGGMAYLSLNNPTDPTYYESGLRATDEEGGWATGDIENATRNGGMYYIVEVDADGDVLIQIYNIFTNSFYGEPYLLDSIYPDEFVYTTDRRDNAVMPEYAEGAQLKALSKNHKNMLIEIPQAICKDVVQGYRVEAYQGNTLVTSVYRLSGAEYGDAAPEKVKAYISGLEPATAYTIKAYAISSYALVSDPLVINVTTDAISATPNADIFNIQFNTDGTATNAATGEVLKKYGAPAVAYDSTIGMNVATFDGDDAYAYMGLPNWTSELSDGFTFETYAYVTARPIGGNYWDILSAQQSGGFGFEYKSDQKVYAYCFIGSGWKAPSAAVPVGQWAHMTGVYDGSTVKIYINGALAAETAVSGSYRAASYLANFLCVGADAGTIVPQNYAKSKVAMAKVYSEPLTAQQIAGLYADLAS